METFETYRPYLFAIAYRMLGSAMDAEDLVQETYRTGEKAFFVLVLDVEHGQIQTIWVIANPDKLTRV